MAKGRSRKGYGKGKGGKGQAPAAVIALVIIILGMGLVGGNAGSGTGDAGGGFLDDLLGNTNAVVTQNAGSHTSGGGAQGSTGTAMGDGAGANGGASSDSSTSSAQGTYDATSWDEVTYPNYVRDAGPAIVDADAPAAGTIRYGGLDALGRTQAAVGTITYKMYQDSKGWREDFSSDADKISGWGHNAKVSIAMPNGKTYNGYMYNRSHLIADSLGGKAERDNLVTGTRTQNVGANDGKGGMAYTETMARDWLETHHDGTIYYKATPVYVGNELVPRSVYIDIKTSDGSIDKHVEVYNTTKGYTIDYMTGEFRKD